MRCFEHAQAGVDTEAVGICARCGVALCDEHSELMPITQPVFTGNVVETKSVPARLFLCETDASAYRAGYRTAVSTG